MKNAVIVSVLLIALFSSCSKDDHIDKEPSIVISVSNENGDKFSGAVVLLYDNYHDWYEMTNPVHAGVTNENGEILFENLQETIYYFDATYSETHWNYPLGVYRTEQPLKKGIQKNVSVVLFENLTD